MRTQYFDVTDKDSSHHQDDSLRQAARFLQQGFLVAMPTETTYGLAASIFNKTALERLYQIKQRSKRLPLPVQVANIEQIKWITKEIPSDFDRLANSFLPGPLTVVLKKSDRIPDLITANRQTVAVRFSSNKVATKVVELAGCPVALSSANRSGHPSCVSARHVLEDFRGKVECIVDGGDAKFGLESTLISLENPEAPLILRLGAISQNAIEKSLKREVQVDRKALKSQTAHKSLGGLPPIRLFSSWNEMKMYLLLSNQTKRLIMSQNVQIPEMRMCDLFELTKNNFYIGLRKAMHHPYGEVLVLCTPNVKRDEMLYWRLKQTASS